MIAMIQFCYDISSCVRFRVMLIAFIVIEVYEWSWNHGSGEAVYGREMECIERKSNNTFYPFKNKRQIHRHLQTIKLLCPLKNWSSNKMG